MHQLNLIQLPNEFSLYQFKKDYKLSPEILNLPWYSISKTTQGVTLLLPTATPLANKTEAQRSEDEWFCLYVENQIQYGPVGVLASIIDPLRDNRISVYVTSIYDTDYVFVKKEDLEKTVEVLTNKNIVVKDGVSVV
ncbi:ACT domain-containing protein [Spinellus fusiger]|nr:ACT domain-containing protein [Spinellus fusiger]